MEVAQASGLEGLTGPTGGGSWQGVPTNCIPEPLVPTAPPGGSLPVTHFLPG